MILLINKPFEYCLRLAGFWPYDFNILGPLAVVSAIFTTLPFQCWHSLGLTSNAVLLMDSLSDLISMVLIYIKIFIMWKNRSWIIDIIRDVYDDWNRKMIPEEWKSLAYYSHLFCNIDLLIYFCATLCYYPDILMSYIGKPKESRKLLFQSYYPFDFQRSPVYEIINMMQIIQGILICIIDSLSKSLLVTLILHVSAHVELLKSHIQVYSRACVSANNNNNYKSDVDLKHVIEAHLKILILVQKIDAAYSGVSLSQLLFSNVVICVTGFVIITAMESANIMLLVKFILFIIVMFSQAFTFCIAGQYLRNKGESIIDMVYNCLWYNMKPSEIKAVMFILANAQTPLTLYGGKLFELSTGSLTMIVKTAVSYLSVLRAVYA